MFIKEDDGEKKNTEKYENSRKLCVGCHLHKSALTNFYMKFKTTGLETDSIRNKHMKNYIFIIYVVSA